MLGSIDAEKSVLNTRINATRPASNIDTVIAEEIDFLGSDI